MTKSKGIEIYEAIQSTYFRKRKGKYFPWSENHVICQAANSYSTNFGKKTKVIKA